MTNLLEIRLQWPKFAEPMLLFLAFVPLLLLAWVWLRRGILPQNRVVLPFDHVAMKRSWFTRWLITSVESVPALVLLIAVLILAGPQVYGPPKEKRSLTNIQMAVDVSGSMRADYGEGDRYDAAMKAVDNFVDKRKGDAFGLTFFGDAYVHWVPLTSDVSAIKCSTPFMRPELVPPPFYGTAIGKVLKACKKELLTREEGDRMLLLITDGEAYDLGDYEAIARGFVDEKITLFVVITADFDPQAELVHICNATGGQAFRADDPEILDAVFLKIDEMQKAKLTPTFVDHVDYFPPFALVGLGFLIIGILGGLGLRYTPW